MARWGLIHSPPKKHIETTKAHTYPPNSAKFYLVPPRRTQAIKNQQHAAAAATAAGCWQHQPARAGNISLQDGVLAHGANEAAPAAATHGRSPPPHADGSGSDPNDVAAVLETMKTALEKVKEEVRIIDAAIREIERLEPLCVAHS